MMTSVPPKMISGSYTDAGSGNPEIIPPQVAWIAWLVLTFGHCCACFTSVRFLFSTIKQWLTLQSLTLWPPVCSKFSSRSSKCLEMNSSITRILLLLRCPLLTRYIPVYFGEFGGKEHHMTFCLFTDIDFLHPYNPCTSKSDQQVISPYYTNTLSSS